MSDLDCRVAKVEQRLDDLCRELNEDKSDIKAILETISGKIESLSCNNLKQSGFLAGAIFAIGSLGSLITYAITMKWVKL